MKRNTAFIFLPLFFAFSSMAQADVSQSRWQQAKVIADGSNNEWKKPLNLYDAVTGLLFTISNDSSNLYLCFTNNDERKVTKLMKAGWNIEIFSKEKNKKFDAGITFPAVQMINAPGKDDGVAASASPQFKSETALYRLNVKTVKTGGFANANGDIPVANANGINIGIGSDTTQEIIFEIVIPFKELFPLNNMQLNEEITMTVTVNALKKQMYHGDPDGKDLVGKGGGGRGRKGGGSAENAAFQSDRSLLYTQIDFKQKFKLSNK